MDWCFQERIVACRAVQNIIEAEEFRDAVQRRKEASSVKLQLSSAARLACQALGQGSKPAERLAAARDALDRITAAADTHGAS